MRLSNINTGRFSRIETRVNTYIQWLHLSVALPVGGRPVTLLQCSPMSVASVLRKSSAGATQPRWWQWSTPACRLPPESCSTGWKSGGPAAARQCSPRWTFRTTTKPFKRLYPNKPFKRLYPKYCLPYVLTKNTVYCYYSANEREVYRVIKIRSSCNAMKKHWDISYVYRRLILCNLHHEVT